MKKHYFLALAAVIIATMISPPFLSAQPSLQWHRTSGYEDIPCGVAADAMGNVYVAGTASVHQFGYAAVKYSPEGALLWTANYNGGPVHFDPDDMVVDFDGNLYVTGGGSLSGWVTDYITIKYAPQGQRLWMAAYDGAGGGDYAKAIAVDLMGNVYVTGNSRTSASGDYDDIATIKYSPEGEVLWVVRYDGPIHKNDVGKDIVVDKLGNVYVTGQTDTDPSTNNNINYITIKYNSNGLQQWVATYDSHQNGQDYGEMLVLDFDLNVYVTGHSSEGGPNLWAHDLLTIKYNNLGQERWVARFDGQVYDSYEDPSALALDPSGNVLIAAHSTNGVDYGTFIILKYSSDGNRLWVNYGNQDQRLKDLTVDEEGNIFVTGSQNYPPGDNIDCVTLEYNPDGNLMWGTRFSLMYSQDIGRHIALDQDNNILVAGTTRRYGGGDYFEDFLTLKYNGGGSDAVASAYPAATSVAAFTCAPNPFNPSTVVSFELRVPSHVSLKVYDTAGRLVATLVEGWQEAGTHSATFDGSKLPSGLYFLRMQAGDVTAVQKVMLLK